MIVYVIKSHGFIVGRGLTVCKANCTPAENTPKICIINLSIIFHFIYRQNNLLVFTFRQEQAPALQYQVKRDHSGVPLKGKPNPFS